MKDLLIIGGTGFFGKSIMDSFLRKKLDKFQIKNLIVLSRSAELFLEQNPSFISPNIKFLNGDITLINKLPYADIVIHAATSSKQINYIQNSNREKENTEKGVSNYLRLAKTYHKNSKIVYCSSGAVYGKQPSDILNIKEDYPFQDINNMSTLKRDYALSKRNAEKLFINSGEDDLNISIARCFAFYGKYLPEDGHFAYGSFLKSAKKGSDIVVNANHEVIRSYMSADDMVNSLIEVALHSKPQCPIYNVGSDLPISIFSLAQNIADEYNVKVVTKNNIDFNVVDRYVPDISKLKLIL